MSREKASLDRQQRLAAALRDNLRRRKTASRPAEAGEPRERPQDKVGVEREKDN